MSKYGYLNNKTRAELVKCCEQLIRENVRLIAENQDLRLREKISNEERSIHDNAFSMACENVLDG